MCCGIHNRVLIHQLTRGEHLAPWIITGLLAASWLTRLVLALQVDQAEAAAPTPAPQQPAAPSTGAADAAMFDAVDEELQLALQMSMGDGAEQPEKKEEGK